MPPCEGISTVTGTNGLDSNMSSPSPSAANDIIETNQPWVVAYERSNMDEVTLMDIMETYEDVLEKYGILHLRGLVTKVSERLIVYEGCVMSPTAPYPLHVHRLTFSHITIHNS